MLRLYRKDRLRYTPPDGVPVSDPLPNVGTRVVIIEIIEEGDEIKLISLILASLADRGPSGS